DQFGRRRRRHILWTSAGVAVVGGVIVLGPVTGVIAGGTWGLWNVLNTASSLYEQSKVRARIVLPGASEPVPIRLKQLGKAAIVARDGDWALHLVFDSGPTPGTIGERYQWTSRLGPGQDGSMVLRGDDALRAAGRLLPAINRSGAKRDEV